MPKPDSVALLLEDERPSVRLRTLKRLRHGAGTAYLDQIVELLDDPDALVAGQAAEIVVVERPTEPRLVNALVQYVAVATDAIALVDALGATIASQPHAQAAVDALCRLLSEPEPPGCDSWTNEHVPYRQILLISASHGARNINVARAVLTSIFDADPRVATAAVDALTFGSPELAPEIRAALAEASSTPLRARLLAVLSLVGETSHIDAIRRLIASDDAAPWGASQSFMEPTHESRLALLDIRSTAKATPARWVGGLLAIQALRSRKSELLPELRRIVAECEDPVVVATATDEISRIEQEVADPDEASAGIPGAH